MSKMARTVVKPRKKCTKKMSFFSSDTSRPMDTKPTAMLANRQRMTNTASVVKMRVMCLVTGGRVIACLRLGVRVKKDANF